MTHCTRGFAYLLADELKKTFSTGWNLDFVQFEVRDRIIPEV
jgi:hypothetical protein